MKNGVVPGKSVNSSDSEEQVQVRWVYNQKAQAEIAFSRYL